MKKSEMFDAIWTVAHNAAHHQNSSPSLTPVAALRLAAIEAHGAAAAGEKIDAEHAKAQASKKQPTWEETKAQREKGRKDAVGQENSYRRFVTEEHEEAAGFEYFRISGWPAFSKPRTLEERLKTHASNLEWCMRAENDGDGSHPWRASVLRAEVRSLRERIMVLEQARAAYSDAARRDVADETAELKRRIVVLEADKKSLLQSEADLHLKLYLKGNEPNAMVGGRPKGSFESSTYGMQALRDHWPATWRVLEEAKTFAAYYGRGGVSESLLVNAVENWRGR